MKKLICIILFFYSVNNISQEKKAWKFKDNVTLNGYVKYLPSISFSNLNKVYTNTLIHHRLNIKAYFGDAFSAKIAMRNRITFGDLVKQNPNYGESMTTDESIKLSFFLVNENNLVVHSVFDRAYLDYFKGNWQVTLGRQRINWGVNLAWNSNDLFNAYNIVDFDYEEKNGADAIRIQYASKKGKLDFAYNLGENLDESTIALLYKFNKWKYDWQLITANFNEDITFGLGWEGSIKNAGFKGEVTTFFDKISADAVISSTTSIDYFFKKGLYLNGSLLYSSNGQSTFSNDVLQFTESTLSAKNLMPTKYSILIQASKEFNPRFKSSFTTIYGAGMDLLFLMPAIDYSIKENWDVNITGQVFYIKTDENSTGLSNSIYVRFRYSY